jgi:hypothetical protein
MKVSRRTTLSVPQQEAVSMSGGLKKENPRLYELAKRRVLALGFGCGAEKFAEICHASGFDLRPEWERKWSAMVEPSPGRNALFRMFRELERAGVEITVTDEETTMSVGESVSLERVKQIFARHLPKTLKVVERPSSDPNTRCFFEIILDE